MNEPRKRRKHSRAIKKHVGRSVNESAREEMNQVDSCAKYGNDVCVCCERNDNANREKNTHDKNDNLFFNHEENL